MNNPPRILWLVSLLLPEPAAALGLSASPGGGWIAGQRQQLKDTVRLHLVCVDARLPKPTRLTLDGVEYTVLPTGSEAEFSALLAKARPDLIHLWGSEYAAARTLARLADPARTLLSLQGIMAPYAAHILDGVPARCIRSGGFQRFLTRFTPGELLDKKQAYYDRQAVQEQELLDGLRHVTGRTPWDKAEMERLAPRAAYYPCNETLRPLFYEGQWQGGPQPPVLFVSQGNEPRKGLHRLLQALPPVLALYPGLKIRVAGWPPVDKGPLLAPVVRALLPYQTWLQTLVKQLGLQGVLEYTGPLDEAGMKQALLTSSLFVMPSSIENSPNSLGEAMLLGMPCVASTGGGTPGMMTDGTEGLLYPPDDIPALTAALLALLGDPARAAALGRAARRRAAVTHDPVRNGKAMLDIYRTILASPAQVQP